MARSFSHCKPSIFRYSTPHKPSFTPLNHTALTFAGKPPLPIDSYGHRITQRPSIVFAAIRCGGTSSLNAPLEPTSLPGRSIGGVLRNDPDCFYDAVSSELNRLSDDRDSALARLDLSSGSPEACLHRRIVELKEEEYQPLVEDIMYMIICKKFLEIQVPLVTSLDKCLYNGRLEILPSKEGDLETIHSLEVLEMIRGYLTTVLGQKAGSSVMVSWAPPKIERLQLSKVYAASVFYGYFLKSASLRHRLELNISMSYLDAIPSNRWAFLFGSGFYGIKSIALGEFSAPQVQHPQGKPPPKLKLYVQGLDEDALQVCSKLRSKVAMDLVLKHCSALFAIKHAYLVDSKKTYLNFIGQLEEIGLGGSCFRMLLMGR